MAEYIKLEDLEDACRINGIPISHVLDGILRMTEEDITNDMSLSERIALLEKHEQVFATQIWTKDDIIATLKSNGVENPDDSLVEKIAEDVTHSLTNCSYGWSSLDHKTKQILNGRK